MIRLSPDALRLWATERFPSRTAAEQTEVVWRLCPVCGHTGKWSHYLNVERGVYYCHRNGCSATAVHIVKLVEGLSSTRQVAEFIAKYGGRLWFDAAGAAPPGTTALQRVRAILSRRDPSAATDGEFLRGYPAGWDPTFAGLAGAAIRDYARRRGIPEWFVGSGRLGKTRDSLVGRLVALVFEAGEPVYSIGRAIRPDVLPKYLYPPDSLWGRGKADVVFNLDLWDEGDTLIVCEGFISALSAGHGAIATGGQGMSDTQAAKIAAARPGEVILLREQDVAEARIVDAAHRLSRRGVETYVAPLIHGDPNDDPSQMPEVLAGARPVTLRDRLRARATAGRKKPLPQRSL